VKGILIKKEYDECEKDMKNDLQIIESNLHKQLSSFLIIVTSFVLYEIVRATNPAGYEGIISILYRISYLLLVLLVLPIMKLTWDLLLMGLQFLNKMMGGR
jgi:hypothetical protein